MVLLEYELSNVCEPCLFIIRIVDEVQTEEKTVEKTDEHKNVRNVLIQDFKCI